MMMSATLIAASIALFASNCDPPCNTVNYTSFSVGADEARMYVEQDGMPVATYNYGMVQREGRDNDPLRRSGYLHPVYGLDGEVLTDDFPADHVHHRGIFWAWPKAMANGREMDVWSLRGARQVYEESDPISAVGTCAYIKVRNLWIFDDAPGKPMLREHVTITFLPAEETHRAIDIELRLENISGAPFTLGGQTTGDKGYGGVCIRPANGSGLFSEDESNSPFRFLGKDGLIANDAFTAETPWCALLLKETPGAPRNGIALIQHPDNPGYPQPGWLIRHYGFLGQSWPHRTPHLLPPNQSITLRYRILITRGLTELQHFTPLATPPNS
jgi:hypothetical protein